MKAALPLSNIKALLRAGTHRNEEALDQMGSIHPIGRIGRPEEIADAVAWLFSEKSSYYTGQSLTLDGGLNAQGPYMTRPVDTAAVEEQRSARKTD